MAVLPIGIMQGRLSPRRSGVYQYFPAEDWEQEFFSARALGFACIEFIFDRRSAHRNPLLHEKGRERIRELTCLTGVKVLSVCADYFMEEPLHSRGLAQAEKSMVVLKELISASADLGIKDITIPCVDESRLEDGEDVEMLKKALLGPLGWALKAQVRLNLETDLGPRAFRALIGDLAHPCVRVNYDTGNSASLGYDPEEEIVSYGEFVSVLHVKDRLKGGGSVKLGQGAADFKKVFTGLKDKRFKGTIIMQAARAEDGDEVSAVKGQLEFLKSALERWF